MSAKSYCTRCQEEFATLSDILWHWTVCHSEGNEPFFQDGQAACRADQLLCYAVFARRNGDKPRDLDSPEYRAWKRGWWTQMNAEIRLEVAKDRWKRERQRRKREEPEYRAHMKKRKDAQKARKRAREGK